VQFIPSGQHAEIAFWRKGNFCIQAGKRKLHSALQRAKTALLVNAEFARLLNAKIARDSY
jgi:hypothetical protein